MSTALLGPEKRTHSDDEPLFEIVNGQRVELPPTSFFACLLTTRLVVELGAYLRTDDLGHLAGETLFHLPAPVNRNRRPDLAFVSYGRWAKDRAKDKEENAWDVVPNLVTEVVSTNDDAKELLDKLAEYFQAGVELVWVVYPTQAMVYVYRSMTDVHGLTRNDTLDGGAVLPNFKLALANLFVD